MAVLPPGSVAVIVAAPADTSVMTPLNAPTVATAGLEETYVAVVLVSELSHLTIRGGGEPRLYVLVPPIHNCTVEAFRRSSRGTAPFAVVMIPQAQVNGVLVLPPVPLEYAVTLSGCCAP